MASTKLEATVHDVKSGQSRTINLDDVGPPPEVYYNSDGLVQVGLNEAKAAAKKVVGRTESLYYLKSGPDGVYNPLSMYSLGTQHLTSTKHGKKVWSYIKVSKDAFDLYIKFLQTKNLAHYQNANRLVNTTIV